MSLTSQLETDFKQAMLAKDRELIDLLRLLKAALKNEMISLKKQELADKEVLKVLKKEAKKRQDSIEQFAQGNRQDLVDKEKQELEMIQKYLPEEMSQDKIKQIVEEVVAQMGEVAPSQFGQVMGQVMAKVKGQADGSLVSQVVKDVLNNS